MPIQINLLSEALAEEELRRRDPVKRAIFFGALLVVLSLVWFSSSWLNYVLAKSQLTKVQEDIHTRTNAYNDVLGNVKKINEMQEKLKALQTLSAARFLQGNLLNALQTVYTPNVQLERLRVDQTYNVNLTTNKTAANHSSSLERIFLFIDAKDSSPNPGDQVNHFKAAVQQQSYFKTNLDPTNSIRLSNLSSAQFSADGKPFVLFTLECHFLDQKR